MRTLQVHPSSSATANWRPAQQPLATSVRLGIGAKVLVSLLAMAIMLAAVGAFSVSQLEALHQTNLQITDHLLPVIRALALARSTSERYRATQLEMVVVSNPVDLPPLEAELDLQRQIFDSALNVFEPVADVGREQDLLTSAKKNWARYVDDNTRKVLPLLRANRQAEATTYLQTDGKQVFDALYNDFLLALIDIHLRESREAGLRSAQVFADSQKLIFSAIAAALLAATGLGLFLSRTIGRPVGEVTAAAQRLARGDLTQTLAYESSDELGRMANSFRDMVGNMREMVSELQEGAQHLSASSSEILAANAQQAASAAEQSAAIAQTTATVDEVRASSEQAAGMAGVVAEAAQEANRVAGNGVSAVREAVASMQSIRQRMQSIAENILALSAQSQQIGDIIATVSDLADQSNLLALNAAIEASRAGEQGKGFSVVAQEIRNLAEQSKSATGQVRTILSDIQRATNVAVMATEQGTKGVDSGAELIDRTGRTIEELAEAVQSASRSAAQVSASVRQHAVGMEQIGAAMDNINQATAQSLAASSDTRNAAQNLTTLAVRLDDLVAQYQV